MVLVLSALVAVMTAAEDLLRQMRTSPASTIEGTTFVRYFFKEITAKINQGNSHMLLHPTRSELITHTNIYGHVVQSSKTTDPTTIITTIFFFWWDTLVVVFISFSDGIATYKDVQAHAPR